MWLVFACVSAVFFGLRGILYQWTSQKPMNRNLMLFGVFMNGAVFSLILSLLLNQEWTSSVLIGLLMGIFSFSANASMYKGYAVGKASLVAVFSSLPAIVVIVLAYILWRETVTLWQFIAFITIIIGILFIRYSSDFSLKHMKGVLWGLLAMTFFALNDVSGKQAMLLDADYFPLLFVMFITGSICFGSWWLIDKAKLSRNATPQEATEITPKTPLWKDSKTFLWGFLVGFTHIGGMFFILQAFKLGVTGLVSAVVTLNVVLILFYTRLFLKEKLSRNELIGIGLALLGIVVLRVLGN